MEHICILGIAFYYMTALAQLWDMGMLWDWTGLGLDLMMNEMRNQPYLPIYLVVSVTTKLVLLHSAHE